MLIFFCAGLSGCYKKYNSDYIKKYKKFLEYSLGEYTVADKRVLEWSANPLPLRGEGIYWELEFLGSKNQERIFSFKNYGGSKGSDDSNFGFYTIEYAMWLGREQIYNDIVYNYFKADEIGVMEYHDNRSKTSVFILNEFPLQGEDYYKKCIDDKEGIQINTITAKELIKQWEGKYRFQVNTAISDGEELNKLKNKIESMMREVFVYLEDDTITIDVQGEDYEHSYRAIYNKELDIFKWYTLADIYEEEKYKDGHLLEVDKIIVNSNN